MAGWVIRSFKGIAPKLAPQLLADNQAQEAVNTKLWGGSLRPLRQNTTVIEQLPKTGTIKTIYRFGRASPNELQYWFHWPIDVDVAKGFVSNDLVERTFWTGDGYPKVTNSEIGTTGTNYPANAYKLGIPKPNGSVTATVTGTPTAGSNNIPEGRTYVVTYVSAWGEEGMPCTASQQVSVRVGQTVALADLPGAPSGNYNITKKRIYRSVTGTASTPFLFVAEVPIAQATFTDNVTATGLGEALMSQAYTMPPETLKGLTAMAGGVLAGFDGYDLWFSEPLKPHAWPIQYSLTTDYPIVAIEAYDSSLLVLTTGYPYIVSGSDPSNYVMIRSELAQACVAKRSVVKTNGGIVFATPDGLYLSGGAGTTNLTGTIFTRQEWQQLEPEKLVGFTVDNKYLGFFEGTGRGFLLDPETADFTTLDWEATAGFYDAQLDELFLVEGGRRLVKFDAGAPRMFRWRSKAFYVPRPITLGSARVEAAGYPLECRIYADGQLRYVKTVHDQYAFRLPSGFTAKIWEIEVVGDQEVFSVGFAQSMQELQNG